MNRRPRQFGLPRSWRRLVWLIGLGAGLVASVFIAHVCVGMYDQSVLVEQTSELAQTLSRESHRAVYGSLAELGREECLVQTCTGQLPPGNEPVTHLLQGAATGVNAQLVYVMKVDDGAPDDGLTLASSSYDEGKSLLGNNYGFRSYFKDAKDGGTGLEAAIGVTTGVRGLYYSIPVRDEAETIVGVLVTKFELHNIEALLSAQPMTLALIDPSGIIFAASEPDLLFRQAVPGDVEELRRTRRFGDYPLTPLAFRLSQSEFQFDGQHYLVAWNDLDLRGWKLVGWQPQRENLSVTLLAMGGFTVLYGGLSMMLLLQRRLHRSRREVNRILQDYRTIYEVSADAIFIHDTSGNILDFNSSAAEMLGLPPGQDPSHTTLAEISSGQPGFNAQRGRELIEKAIREGTQQFDWQGKRADGEFFWVSVKLQPCEFRGKHCVLAVARDITERREMINHLQQAKLAAEAATRTKSVFLANISHEIRTPMNAIMGYAQLISRQDLDPKTHEYLRTITQSGEHLIGLINDILEMSKIEAGRQTLTLVTFDFRELLASVEALFSARMRQNKLRFRVTCQEDVPTHLHADEAKIRQVLINLIDNAMKFTDQGSVIVSASSEVMSSRATIGGRGINELVTIEVADTGKGIDPSEYEKIFDAFEQATMLNHPGGAGLGLSISRGYAHMMGGDLTVRGNDGGGSRFGFYFPAEVVTEGPEAPEDNEHAHATLSTSMLAGVSPELKASLQEALSNGDTRAMQTHLDALTLEDAHLSAHLQRLLDAYDHEELHRLLGEDSDT
jgi:PAS domain S-box-containing protein